MTLENVLLVLIVLGVCLFGWWLIHRTKYTKDKTYSTDYTEPQMGFPVERGVTDWQKKNRPPVSEFEEVDALLKRVSKNPLSLQEQRVAVKNEVVVDDPWAREYSQGLLHKIMPPDRTHNQSE